MNSIRRIEPWLVFWKDRRGRVAREDGFYENRWSLAFVERKHDISFGVRFRKKSRSTRFSRYFDLGKSVNTFTALKRINDNLARSRKEI